MNTCPCCSNQMLRHFRHHQLYWFCRSCWQEMPILEQRSLSFISPTLVPHFVPAALTRSLVTV
ncbi:MAG: hypothetical protein KME16_12505 [Scytolyngbya sp. HA4215-MV1]|nr:hypothetical protein [Scytolyngbya sp. HA4215-MV1]